MAAWIGWGGWLAAQPARLGGDDSLFFARGLVHFSVLDFSPHFPGYPGLIALGRLVDLMVGDPVRALFVVSVGGAWALPPAVAWAAARCGARRPALAFAATLACPLLSGTGLALMSDTVGLLALVMGLGALAAGRPAWAGLALGACLTLRPSLAPLAAVPLVWGAWPPGRARFLVGAIGVPVLAFGAVLAWEGPAYVEEGLRFIGGHATLWGNTVVAEGARPGWWRAVTVLPAGGVAVVLALLALGRGWRGLPGVTLAVGVAWTLAMQNPDHLRHLTPLAVLAVLTASTAPWLVAAQGLVHLVMLVASVCWAPAPPPLAAAIDWLAARPDPGLVVSNVGVALMRRQLDGWQVADAYYDADSRFLAAQAAGPVYRLVAGAVADDQTVVAGFPARAPGEEPISLLAWP